MDVPAAGGALAVPSQCSRCPCVMNRKLGARSPTQDVALRPTQQTLQGPVKALDRGEEWGPGCIMCGLDHSSDKEDLSNQPACLVLVATGRRNHFKIQDRFILLTDLDRPSPRRVWAACWVGQHGRGQQESSIQDLSICGSHTDMGLQRSHSFILQ